MAGLVQDAGTAQGLARSVAHRLKYYIDVKRKENSFDSSGVIRDETESTSLCVKDNEQVEHDFAAIKLDASLRAYVGSTEECNRKVQKSAGRQKDLEKLIKRMAQDYVPDKSNEGKGKHLKRQKRSPITPARLHATAIPFMSPKEVRRLISSASKLIVAATSEASAKEPGTPCEGVLSPERKDTTDIQHQGDQSSSCPPFTCCHKEQAKAVQGHNKECITETVKKCGEKNDKEKSNRTEKEKYRDFRRPTDVSSDTSSNIRKSKRLLLRRFPTLSNRDSLIVGLGTPYLETGQNKTCRKSTLRSQTSSASNSAGISDHHDKEANVQWKKTSPSQQPVETRRPCKSAYGTIGVVASCRSASLLKTQPILSIRNPPAVKGLNRKPRSAKPTTKATPTGSTTMAGMLCSSVVVSESALKGQGNTTPNHLDQRSKFVRSSPSNRQKLEQGSKRHPESQKVRFQKLPHKSIPDPSEWKHHGLDGWSTGDLRGPPSDQPIVAEGRCPELVKYLQEDQKKELNPTDLNGSSFLYQVCQGMDEEAPSSLTENRSAKSDRVFEHERTPSLFNRLFFLNEPGGTQATGGPPGTTHGSCNRQTASSPPGSCTYSEPPNDGASETLGEHSSGSPLITTTVLERWGDGLSEEEFTISSPSRSSSASLFASTQEQMNGNANIDLKEEEQNANYSTETLVQKILDMMGEESATPRGTFGHPSGFQGREELSSPAADDRRDTDYSNGDGHVSRVVYFSQLPTSL